MKVTNVMLGLDRGIFGHFFVFDSVPNLRSQQETIVTSILDQVSLLHICSCFLKGDKRGEEIETVRRFSKLLLSGGR